MALDTAQEYTVEIAAAQLECFDVITDFDSYPRWSSAIERAKVLERDAAGMGRTVEFLIDMRVKTIRYVLEYSYRKPRQLTWRSVDGDVESIEGAYRLRKRSAKVTQATCQQQVQLGFWVPGPVRRLAERTALQQSVEEFKTEVERRVMRS